MPSQVVGAGVEAAAGEDARGVGTMNTDRIPELSQT
jgi:hypothetical protein